MDKTLKNQMKLLNEDVWLKYSHHRYLPLEDIKHRLSSLGLDLKSFSSLKKDIQALRKAGSISFFIEEIGQCFWYFPSDCIMKKAFQIEKQGIELYKKIQNYKLINSKIKKAPTSDDDQAKLLFDAIMKRSKMEEAITSALYEGANSTRAQAKAFLQSDQYDDKLKNKGYYMVVNNYKAMQWIKENQSLSLSNSLICKLHEIITHKTLEGDDANFYGRFRNEKIFVGKHEGLNFSKIEKSLTQVIKLINNPPRFVPSLIKATLLHYFLSYIHPFFDGNGRTARALFYFQCMKKDLKFIELLSLSANLKDFGKKYAKSFDLAKQHEFDMTFFIDFCFDSLLKALDEMNSKIQYLFSISKIPDLNENQILCLQKLTLNKFRKISIESYAKDIKKSRELARLELKELVEKKLLIEEKIKNKLWYQANSKYLKSYVKNLNSSNNFER